MPSAFAGLPMMRGPLGDSQIMDGAHGNYNHALQARHFSSNMIPSNQDGSQSASVMFGQTQDGQSTSAMFGQGVSPNPFAGASGPNNIRHEASSMERLTSMIQADREEELLLQLLIGKRRRQGAPAVSENVMGDELLRLRQAGIAAANAASSAAAAASSAAIVAAMFNAERQANMVHPQSIPSTGLQVAHSILSPYGTRQTTVGSTMFSHFGQTAGGMIMPLAAPPIFLGMNSQQGTLGNLRPGSLGNTASGSLGVIDDYIDDYLLSTSRQQHQEAMMAGVSEQQRQERIQEHSPSLFLGNMTNPRNELNHKSLDGDLVANKKRGLEEVEQIAFDGGSDLSTVYPLKKRKRFLKINKKPADMPRRPLSAYNLFFSEERERILLEIDPKRAQEKQAEAAEEASGESKPKALPRPLLPSPQKKRRPHRKTHGKISFKLLAQMVGRRWKALADENRKYYQELAQEDMKRQERAMEEYYDKK
jgi:hypothetical protein